LGGGEGKKRGGKIGKKRKKWPSSVEQRGSSGVQRRRGDTRKGLKKIEVPGLKLRMVRCEG